MRIAILHPDLGIGAYPIIFILLSLISLYKAGLKG